MNKKLRRIILGILIGAIGSNVIVTNVQAYEEDNSMHKIEITEEEQKENDEKLKLAEEYVENKERARGYGGKKSVSMSPVAQQKSYWCGPATAYCATKGAVSQSIAAEWLKTTTDGTNLTSNWSRVLNTFRKGNNYTVMKASGYSDWRSKLKNSIIYTIDKGYPVVADCKITPNSSTWIHSGYQYAKAENRNVYHYVTIGGYDDLASTNPARVEIGDSNTRSSIQRRYWTSLDTVSAATKEMGIVW